MEGIQLSLFGKTSQERFHQATGWTLRPCCDASRTPKFQALILDDGLTPEWFEADELILHGGSWMPNFGECPSAAAESSLLQILEENPHPKYYLSPKACAGILRRADKRKKELPDLLYWTLKAQIARGSVTR